MLPNAGNIAIRAFQINTHTNIPCTSGKAQPSPQGAFTHEWLDRLEPRCGLAPELLLGRPHKAETFCPTAALFRPQHGGTDTENGSQTPSTTSLGPGGSHHISAVLLSPLQGVGSPRPEDPYSHLGGSRAPTVPATAPFPGSLRHKRFQKVAQGAAASPTKPATASAMVGILGVSSKVPLDWKCLGTLKP